MTQATLNAQAREKTGKGPARALRREGRLPAIIYGGKGGETNISVDLRETTKVYVKGHFQSQLLQIELGKEKIAVLPRDVQLHPVTDQIEHVDFLRIEKGQKVRVAVPVRFLNAERSPGLKRGGVLNIVRHDVELYCNPEKIPAFIEADLNGTRIGQSIHISHIALPEGCEPVIRDRDFTVAAVAGRGKEEEEKTAVAGAAGAAAAPAAGGAA
ncbi:MAG: ribosomal protein L25/ral stress protein Ctc [Rickettsiales bacterium]|jgi:large subunit ribosomal protein L25|nr:ribosomal protein L25/ral stress protein Ctc [Rickettsiales bacterium]